MPIPFPVPRPWKSQGWRLKIQDKERVEAPHLTILCKAQKWRLNLRTGSFMDGEPDPSEVPQGLVKHVLANLEIYRIAWDGLYPENPVQSREG